jgi:putative endonuclease
MPVTDASRKALGRRGEDIAAAYLEGQGYSSIARNWRTRAGELDLVARDGEWLVFVEVRARRCGPPGSEPAFGPPEDSITPRKQQRLVTMADTYLFENPWDGPWRIDIIFMECKADGSVLRLNHLRDAVSGG